MPNYRLPGGRPVGRHLRRVWVFHQERQAARLLEWKVAGEALRVNPSDAGLYTVGWLEKDRMTGR